MRGKATLVLFAVLAGSLGWLSTASADTVFDSQPVPPGPAIPVLLFGGGGGGAGGVEMLFTDVTVGGVMDAAYSRLNIPEFQALYGADPSALNLGIPGEPYFAVWEFTPDSNLVFDGPVTITFHYGQGLMEEAGAYEQSLGIYWYNPATDAWEPMQGTSDPVLNFCTIWTTHFSTFSIGGVPEPATLALLALGGLAAMARQRREMARSPHSNVRAGR